MNFRLVLSGATENIPRVHAQAWVWMWTRAQFTTFHGVHGKLASPLLLLSHDHRKSQSHHLAISTRARLSSTSGQSLKMEPSVAQPGGHGQVEATQISRMKLHHGNNEQPQPFASVSFFIHTSAGSIPHLTQEALDIAHVSKHFQVAPVQMSIDGLSTVADFIGPSGMALSKFVGLPSHPTMLTVNNPLTPLPPNYNDKFGVSIWSRVGRETLTLAKFNKIVADLKPNFYQLLSDYDVSRTSSKKRLKKSIDRNLDFVKTTFEALNTASAICSDSQLGLGAYATIEFNWFLVDAVEASKAISSILEHRIHLAGFVIHGVADHLNKDKDPEHPCQENEILETLAAIISQLPNDKLKYTPGSFHPSTIVKLVRLGVNQFDSSFVSQLTDKGCALKLRQNKTNPENGAPIPTETLVTNDDSVPSGNDVNSEFDANSLVMTLKDKIYFEDFRPLSESCSCYTCRKFTRSYIHHLLVTQELLAMVLLMIHNLFCFEVFFDVIRRDMGKDTDFDTLWEVSSTNNKDRYKLINAKM